VRGQDFSGSGGRRWRERGGEVLPAFGLLDPRLSKPHRGTGTELARRPLCDPKLHVRMQELEHPRAVPPLRGLVVRPHRLYVRCDHDLTPDGTRGGAAQPAPCPAGCLTVTVRRFQKLIRAISMSKDARVRSS